MNRTLILAGAAVSALLVPLSYAQSPAYPAPVPAAPAAAPRSSPPPTTSIPMPGAATPDTAAPTAPLPEASNPKLRDELLAMRDEDQRIRRAWIANPKDEAIKAESKVIDERNVARVTAIIDQFGWPTPAMVGQKGSAAAWLIIQHAPLSVQEKYLEAMKTAAKHHDLSWALVATTIDRVLIGQGKLQLYGTQYDTTSGHFAPLPIEDPAQLDARRRQAGMTTMADYDEVMRRTYNQTPKTEKRPIGPAPNVNPH